MGILCRLGRHSVIARGVRNEEREFGRCDRCRCDLMRQGAGWKPVPKGYRIVWRPRTGNPLADQVAGQAAVGREVTVKGVVVGERAYGSQRFALVRLNATDERRYCGQMDRLGTRGAVAAQMEKRVTSGLLKPELVPPPQSREVAAVDDHDGFDWEGFQSTQKAARDAASRLMLTSADWS